MPITEADLETIEKKMIELSRNKEQLIRTEVSKADALKNFTEKGDPYKVELIRDLEDGTISFYTNGAFTDLCRGPHLPNTGLIKAIKLTSVAGAYWRGNEKNKMLTRIYGVAYPKKSELDDYLHMMEEARKRDHRKLGRELGLFYDERRGTGLPLLPAKGNGTEEHPSGLLEKAPPGERLCRGVHTYYLKPSPVGELRTLGSL